MGSNCVTEAFFLPKQQLVFKSTLMTTTGGRRLEEQNQWYGLNQKCMHVALSLPVQYSVVCDGLVV